MCDHGCGIEVDVADSQPVALKGDRKHPYGKGWLYAKGKAALVFFYHPNRLATPVIKKEAKLLPIDWNRSLYDSPIQTDLKRYYISCNDFGFPSDF